MSEDLDGAEYLEGLLRSLDETIRMNYGILDDKAGLEKLQRDAELRKKRELKERVRSLLGRHERDDEMLPLWRHRLKGVHDPPARLVLKGASLLRVIVQSLILLVIKPHKHILNRKLGSRKAEKQFLHKNLLLYTTSLDHFVCRCVRIPLMSLMDDSLDLEFKPQSRFDLTNARNKRNVLQLKVRVKGVVRALAASTVDGEIIDKLLVCLAQDGNYYKKDFLFQCERAQLEFDSLGGSKNVCLQIDDAPLPVRPSVVKIGDAYFDIARVKMLMLNFVLVRVLIGHVVLSPWFFGACPKPFTHVKRSLHNYRVLASALYVIATRVNPSLEKVSDKERDKPTVQERMQDVENQIMAHPIRLKSRLRGEVAPQIEASPVVKPKVVRRASLLRLGAAPRVDADELMLNPRPTFERLEALHMCLLPETYFASVAPLIEPWIGECAVAVDQWLTALALSVVAARQALAASPSAEASLPLHS